MRAYAVVVSAIFGQQTAEKRFSQNHDMLEALAWIDPISRSACPFSRCDRGAVGQSRMPMVRSRHEVSRSRVTRRLIPREGSGDLPGNPLGGSSSRLPTRAAVAPAAESPTYTAASIRSSEQRSDRNRRCGQSDYAGRSAILETSDRAEEAYTWRPTASAPAAADEEVRSFTGSARSKHTPERSNEWLQAIEHRNASTALCCTIDSREVTGDCSIRSRYTDNRFRAVS